MARGVGKQSLRDLTRQFPSVDDQKRFREAINAKSDLVTAIVQAIEIDYILEQLIVSKLVRRDEETIEILCKENGALSTFFSKIGVAYAFGIIDKEKMDYINVVRRIRNAFAHSRKDISFATPAIREELHSLKMPRDKNSDLHHTIDVIKGLTAPDGKIASKPDVSALTGRAAYVILCMTIVNDLLRHQAAIYEAFRRMLRDRAGESSGSEEKADRQEE